MSSTYYTLSPQLRRVHIIYTLPAWKFLFFPPFHIPTLIPSLHVNTNTSWLSFPSPVFLDDTYLHAPSHFLLAFFLILFLSSKSFVHYLAISFGIFTRLLAQFGHHDYPEQHISLLWTTVVPLTCWCEPNPIYPEARTQFIRYPNQ
jgi:hypothetical protein